MIKLQKTFINHLLAVFAGGTTDSTNFTDNRNAVNHLIAKLTNDQHRVFRKNLQRVITIPEHNSLADYERALCDAGAAPRAEALALTLLELRLLPDSVTEKYVAGKTERPAIVGDSKEKGAETLPPTQPFGVTLGANHLAATINRLEKQVELLAAERDALVSAAVAPGRTSVPDLTKAISELRAVLDANDAGQEARLRAVLDGDNKYSHDFRGDALIVSSATTFVASHMVLIAKIAELRTVLYESDDLHDRADDRVIKDAIVLLKAYQSEAKPLARTDITKINTVEPRGKLVPMTVADAQKKGVCRVCQINDTPTPGNPIVLHYGAEYAHERCLETEKRFPGSEKMNRAARQLRCFLVKNHHADEVDIFQTQAQIALELGADALERLAGYFDPLQGWNAAQIERLKESAASAWTISGKGGVTVGELLLRIAKDAGILQNEEEVE